MSNKNVCQLNILTRKINLHHGNIKFEFPNSEEGKSDKELILFVSNSCQKK